MAFKDLFSPLPWGTKADANDVWIARNAAEVTADKAAYSDQPSAEAEIVQQSGLYSSALLLAALRETGELTGPIDDQRLIESMRKLQKSAEESKVQMPERVADAA